MSIKSVQEILNELAGTEFKSVQELLNAVYALSPLRGKFGGAITAGESGSDFSDLQAAVNAVAEASGYEQLPGLPSGITIAIAGDVEDGDTVSVWLFAEDDAEANAVLLAETYEFDTGDGEVEAGRVLVDVSQDQTPEAAAAALAAAMVANEGLFAVLGGRLAVTDNLDGTLAVTAGDPIWMWKLSCDAEDRISTEDETYDDTDIEIAYRSSDPLVYADTALVVFAGDYSEPVNVTFNLAMLMVGAPAIPHLRTWALPVRAVGDTVNVPATDAEHSHPLRVNIVNVPQDTVGDVFPKTADGIAAILQRKPGLIEFPAEPAGQVLDDSGNFIDQTEDTDTLADLLEGAAEGDTPVVKEGVWDRKGKLAGVITVGESGCDFTDLQAAIDAIGDAEDYEELAGLPTSMPITIASDVQDGDTVRVWLWGYRQRAGIPPEYYDPDYANPYLIDEIYEFNDTAADVTYPHIWVDVTGGRTPAAAATALVDAMVTRARLLMPEYEAEPHQLNVTNEGGGVVSLWTEYLFLLWSIAADAGERITIGQTSVDTRNLSKVYRPADPKSYASTILEIYPGVYDDIAHVTYGLNVRLVGAPTVTKLCTWAAPARVVGDITNVARVVSDHPAHTARRNWFLVTNSYLNNALEATTEKGSELDGFSYAGDRVKVLSLESDGYMRGFDAAPVAAGAFAPRAGQCVVTDRAKIGPHFLALGPDGTISIVCIIVDDVAWDRTDGWNVARQALGGLSPLQYAEAGGVPLVFGLVGDTMARGIGVTAADIIGAIKGWGCTVGNHFYYHDGSNPFGNGSDYDLYSAAILQGQQYLETQLGYKPLSLLHNGGAPEANTSAGADVSGIKNRLARASHLACRIGGATPGGGVGTLPYPGYPCGFDKDSGYWADAELAARRYERHIGRLAYSQGLVYCNYIHAVKATLTSDNLNDITEQEFIALIDRLSEHVEAGRIVMMSPDQAVCTYPSGFSPNAFANPSFEYYDELGGDGFTDAELTGQGGTMRRINTEVSGGGTSLTSSTDDKHTGSRAAKAVVGAAGTAKLIFGPTENRGRLAVVPGVTYRLQWAQKQAEGDGIIAVTVDDGLAQPVWTLTRTHPATADWHVVRHNVVIPSGVTSVKVTFSFGVSTTHFLDDIFWGV